MKWLVSDSRREKLERLMQRTTPASAIPQRISHVRRAGWNDTHVWIRKPVRGEPVFENIGEIEPGREKETLALDIIQLNTSLKDKDVTRVRRLVKRDEPFTERDLDFLVFYRDYALEYARTSGHHIMWSEMRTTSEWRELSDHPLDRIYAIRLWASNEAAPGVRLPLEFNDTALLSHVRKALAARNLDMKGDVIVK